MLPNPENLGNSQPGDPSAEQNASGLAHSQAAPETRPGEAVLKESPTRAKLVADEVSTFPLTMVESLDAGQPKTPAGEAIEPVDSALTDVEKELIADSRAKIGEHFHHLSTAAAAVTSGRLDRKTKQNLVAIIANPHAHEHEWQRACLLLGDYKVRRISREVSYKERVRLAMVASWLLLLYLPYLYCVVPRDLGFMCNDSIPPAAFPGASHLNVNQ